MAFGDQYGRTLDTTDPIYGDWQSNTGKLTTKGAGGLWNAYSVPGGAEEQDRYINPYDPGGGYNSFAQAQKAAMGSGGMMTYRQPSSDFGFEKYVIPALAAVTGFGAAGFGPLAGAGTTGAAGGFGSAVGAGGMGVGSGAVGADVVGGGVGAGTAGAGAGAYDLGGGLSVDQYGNVTGGLFQGGPGTPGAGTFGAGATAGGTLSGNAAALSRLLNGTATPDDYLQLGGSIAPSLLGAYAANKQTGAYKDLASQLSAYGAPSRARYEGSFAPGFSMGNDPGFTDALNQAGKASMHALSTFGNPAGSPNAWAQSQSDLYSKFAYPALQTYRNQNANAGGIGALTTAAPSATTAAIGSQGNVYNAIGGGISDIFNPQPTLAQTLAQYTRMLRGTG